MLKEFFGNYFGFYKKIEVLNKLIDKSEENANYWHKQSEKCQKDFYSLKSKLDTYQKPVDIPSAEITYRRPILVAEKKFKVIGIDIRTFIMPDFNMENKLKAKNLVYDGTQDLDELIPTIYHLAKNGYKYGNDSEYGFNEFWMFPFELQENLKRGNSGDCDDWANLIGSFFAAAKIPRNRWLISIGTTRGGYGHATVYAKDETGIWRHLNSTKPEYESKHLSGYPSNKDKADLPGIKEDGFWFSYNDLFAIHKWDSEEAKKAFELASMPIYIKAIK